MKRRLGPIIDVAFAAAGVLAVRAMGGSWLLVLAMAAAAAATTFVIRRRSMIHRRASDDATAESSTPTTTTPSASLRFRRSRRRSRRNERRTRVRSPRQQQRHELWRVTQCLIAVFLVWNLTSFVNYVSRDNGDTFAQRVATWGRDNHLGSAIDFLETRVYSTPPSKTPAQQLELTPAIAPPSTSPASSASSRPEATAPPAVSPAPSPSPASGSESDTVVTDAPTTNVGASPDTDPPATVAAPLAPTPLTPLFTPALTGEGQWTPIARAAGQDTMWATSIRPLASAGGVVASMVVIDQSHLRTGLFNGAEEPGGKWKRGNRVPAELQPALVAAMNGGFRFEHIKGGYKTEGVTVKPLRDGDATLAVGLDGHVAIGQLGRDLFDDGSWISLRQNLVLIVDAGQSQVQHGLDEGVWWGADYGNEVYVPRSAVCELADGRIAYALVGNVNATQLADSLINLGCVRAMQMDINGTWPVFFTFTTGADGSVETYFLDNRMGGNPNRYLTGSTKEFFAFFDTTLVPGSSVLDN
ncbi:MAG: phosphodiester glycosidase family protein [Ilumatobacteraceae bacterium]